MARGLCTAVEIGNSQVSAIGDRFLEQFVLQTTNYTIKLLKLISFRIFKNIFPKFSKHICNRKIKKRYHGYAFDCLCCTTVEARLCFETK